MRIGRDRRRDDFEINVISLIDVLLTLLMFFVLTTTFVRHHGLQVSLPTASSQATADAPPLVLVIDRDGHDYVGDVAVQGAGVEALKRAIQAAAGAGQHPAVLLQADAMTPHQDVVTAMDALGQLGFTRLSIATTTAHPEH
ncbi:ExbD/TolR family protein [Frateuria aurantia]